MLGLIDAEIFHFNGQIRYRNGIHNIDSRKKNSNFCKNALLKLLKI